MGELSAFLPILLIALAFYFLLIRPQSRRAKQQREMQRALAVGDRIMLTSGVFGALVDVSHPERLDVAIADGVVITVARAAVATVVVDEVGDDVVDETHAPVDEAPTSRPDDVRGRDEL